MVRPAQPGPVSVAFLAGQFLPLRGGAEVATLRDAKALFLRGHDVHVLTLRLQRTWPQAEVLDGIPVRRIGGLFVHGKLRTRFGAKWLSQALIWLVLIRTRRTYAVIHLRHLGDLTLPALLAAFLTDKPVVARISGRGPDVPARYEVPPRLYVGELDRSSPFLITHDMVRNGDIDDLRHAGWIGSLTLRLLRHPRVTFVATSTRIASDLVRYGFRPEQIEVLPTGIELDAYEETARQVRPPAAGDDTPVVVCIAHLRYEKGLDILLHAWQRVHARVPAARLVVAGRGPLERQLRDLAAALGISEQVQFTGMIFDVRPILARGAVFVLPSRHEGLPNALLEAMASGLACVATRVSGSEDVIVDGVSGLLVPPEDPRALASSVLSLLLDPERARAMGEAGRQRIAQAFNQAHVIEQLERLYTAATTRRPAGPASRYTLCLKIAMSRLRQQSIERHDGGTYRQPISARRDE